MRVAFIDKGFRGKSLDMIERINDILEEYRQAGYVLTIRQLYYQLVSRDVIPNNIKSYKHIVGLVGDGRLAGLLDWDMITDRARDTQIPPAWESPTQILEACAAQYRIDPWLKQTHHVEVMVEKDALSGVLEPVCNELRITFTANKGYTSLSNLYEASRRMRRWVDAGKMVVVLYMGDHDPSGIDMTRDITERLDLLTGGRVTDVRRLALNMSQVEEYGPPENPAKTTDSRFEGYLADYGESSWELDALEPRVLGYLVREEVEGLIDTEAWEASMRLEQKQRDDIADMASEYANRSEQDEGEDQEEG